MQYYITKGVFLCVVDGLIVFLDLEHDQYISLEAKMTLPLVSYLSPGPEALNIPENKLVERKIQDVGELTVDDEQDFRKCLKDLIKNNILTTDKAMATENLPVTINIPTLDLSGYNFDHKPHITVKHVVVFLWACSKAFYKVRFFTTERVVRSVKSRKSQNPKNSDLNKIKNLVEIFKILRPVFFTAKNHCLFDSLALIEFMACYDIYSTWVFGVKMGPFQAHCWVQDDNFIYNEDIDKAHFFTPIMIV